MLLNHSSIFLHDSCLCEGYHLGYALNSVNSPRQSWSAYRLRYVDIQSPAEHTRSRAITQYKALYWIFNSLAATQYNHTTTGSGLIHSLYSQTVPAMPRRMRSHYTVHLLIQSVPQTVWFLVKGPNNPNMEWRHCLNQSECHCIRRYRTLTFE